MSSWAELGELGDPVTKNKVQLQFINEFGFLPFKTIEDLSKRVSDLEAKIETQRVKILDLEEKLKPVEVVEIPENPLIKVPNKRNKLTPQQKLKYRLTHFKYRSENTDNFTVEDFIAKVSPAKCYMTGVDIDIYDFGSYHLEHIIPVDLGGSSNLDNLGLAVPWANTMKGNMPLDVFIERCRLISGVTESS